MDLSKNDPDFQTTMRKYFGKPAYVFGMLSSLAFCGGIQIVIFIIMSQLLYAIILSVVAWVLRSTPEMVMDPVFSTFSPAYTALMLFALLFCLCCIKDMTVLNKLQGIGAIFIIALMLFMIGTGFYSLFNTTYEFAMFGTEELLKDQGWSKEEAVRTLVLVNYNYAPLAGMLCVAF